MKNDVLLYVFILIVTFLKFFLFTSLVSKNDPKGTINPERLEGEISKWQKPWWRMLLCFSAVGEGTTGVQVVTNAANWHWT